MSKNLKPEKIVEKAVVQWCAKNDFWMHVIESKATYSKNLGRYLRGNAPEGFPDMVGMTSQGDPCYVELKAAGKRSSARREQIAFLLEAIERGSFAVVVDSPDLLQTVWAGWLLENRSKEFLKSCLPQKFVKELSFPFSSQDLK